MVVKRTLADELKSIVSGRVLVVGVGDWRHGDDAVGPMVAARLEEAGILGVIDAGNTPENETLRIRENAPDTVLFVDAVDFGGRPGDVAVLVAEELRSSGFDTHRMPLKLTMQYLEAELACKCFLLAIQPKITTFGADMCEDVRHSVKNLSEMLLQLLQRN